MARNSAEKQTNGGANLGFDQTLWLAADKLRGHIDAEYQHVVPGLIFLKSISDAFEEQHARFATEKGADPEDRDEHRAVNVFWTPPVARWSYLQGRAKDPLIGRFIDDAMRPSSAIILRSKAFFRKTTPGPRSTNVCSAN